MTGSKTGQWTTVKAAAPKDGIWGCGRGLRDCRRRDYGNTVYNLVNSRAEFEWDDAKASGNLAKHGVPFRDAARVFLDDRSVDFDVSRTSDGEIRRKVVSAIEGRLFSVVYVRRMGRIRLISARRCNAKGTQRYGPLYARP